MPTDWSSFEEIHAAYVKNFVESEGFGIARMIPVDLVDLHHKRVLIDGKEYRVGGGELLGILERNEPVVYKGRVTMKALKMYLEFNHSNSERYEKSGRQSPFQTRTLDEFESAALSRLHKGETIVYNGNAASPRLVGAMRAQEQCVSCHDAEVGDLLGALVYSLIEFPKPQAQQAFPASEQPIRNLRFTAGEP